MEKKVGSSSLFAVFLIGLVLSFLIVKSFAQTPPSFTFTAAGDYSSNATRTTAVLNGMNPANSGADFNLALGDLSYASKTPETAWCDYVKSNVGDTFPFQLIPGNHEDDGPAGNNIDNFELCLPDRIGGIIGRYSREYYFDYPTPSAGGSPFARFIAISPQMTFTDEGQYTYTPGNTHYTWVENAIDSARAAGIRWVVVGMHVNCITIGQKPCGMGESLFNLLIEKKVDLILQGHDHNYQRSKQIAHSPSCISVVPGSYNAACVVDDGSDNIYIKGAGSVSAIVGSGGAGLYDINLADGEAEYFAKFMGNNSNPTWGFLKVNVDSSQLSAQFIPASGTFTDSFTITDSGVPTATPGPATPTPTPSPTPPTGIFTVMSQVNTSDNDAEEAAGSGSVSLSSSDLELGADGSTNQIVGMRFTSVAIPQVATITSAYVELEVDEVTTGTTSVTISGQAADTAAAFTSTTGNISSRSKTVSQVAWNNIAPWDVVDAKKQTPDISVVIQEIVNRPGWISGNSIAVMIQGTGRRTAEAYNGEPLAAAKLVVTYSTGPIPTPTETPIPTPTPTIDPFAPTPTETPSPTVTPTPTDTPTPTMTPIPSLTPTPTPTPNKVFLNPIADTYVRSDKPINNYGTTTTFFVDGSPIKTAYIKFDLSELFGLPVTSAKLRLKVAGDKSTALQSVKSVTDTTWVESTLNYNNRPSLGGVINTFTGPTINTWVEIDITSEVVAKQGQLMSLGIDETSSNGINFYSRETVDEPVLVITF